LLSDGKNRIAALREFAADLRDETMRQLRVLIAGHRVEVSMNASILHDIPVLLLANATIALGLPFAGPGRFLPPRSSHRQSLTAFAPALS